MHNEMEKQKAIDNLQSLESEIRELGKKCDLESVLREELSLEIQTLERSQSRNATCNIQSLQYQNPAQPAPASTESEQANLNIFQPLPSRRTPSPTPLLRPVPVSCATPVEYTNSQIIVKDFSVLPAQTIACHQSATSVKYTIEEPIVSEVAVPSVENSISAFNIVPTSQHQIKEESVAPIEIANTEINRILARIEQDNQILAELEKSRATVDVPSVPVYVYNIKEDVIKERSLPSTTYAKQSVTRQELEQLMAKLEQDNRILAELDKKRNVLDSFSTTSRSSYLVSNNGILGHGVMPSPSPSLGSLREPQSSVVLHGLTSSASTTSLNRTMVPAGHTLIPTSLLQRLAPGTIFNETLTEDEMLDSIDFIELPGRGRCNIFCARYTYDPLKQSPNENPEAELALSAGDYVIIYGDMDEDGFFNGELMDGRKGLVPSNFVEKLSGEELFEFHATVLYGNRDSDDSSVSFSYAQDMEMTVSDDLMHPEDFQRMNNYIDLDDVEKMDQDDDDDGEKDNENFSRGVPPPQRLILERQMNKSLLIGWVPPNVPPGKIEGYHVYVDGVPKSTIQFSERTRALIEGVDSSKPHRVSVRSISDAGFHSKDAACTIVVGKDFPLAPTCVKASHITATSALISWLPSNSNFQHVIAVNSVEVKVVRPGCFRHQVTGLSPNNLYRVSVRVKPGKLLYNDEKNPKKLEMLVSNVEFRTLPKGLPDPPVNVQVEQGPQDGTLLVTWLPVMTSASNALVSSVTGYAVFVAGRKIAEVEGPTGDHALIDGSQLLQLNKKCITVKSKSIDGLSTDSLFCVVPNELLRNIQKMKPKMCKAESINEPDDLQNDELDRIDYQPHSMRRMNQNQISNPVPSQRRQGWKDQSYNSRSMSQSEGNGTMEGINRKDNRNISRQAILDPDENLGVTDLYPSSRTNIPSIASKDSRQICKITKEGLIGDEADTGFSDDECDLRRRRPPSPDRFIGSSSQQRPLRTDMARVLPPQGPGQPRNSPKRHESGDTRAGQPHRQRGPADPSRDQSRRAGRNQSAPQIGSRPLKEAGSKHSYYGKRKGSDNLSLTSQENMRVSDYTDVRCPMYEDLGNFDSFSSHADVGDNRIYGDKDADGFYRGESNGRVGLVPGNMISEVSDDADQSYYNDNVSRPRTVGHIAIADRDVEWQSRRIRKMVAIYDYDPQEISPNVDREMELPFKVGDVIYVIGDVDEDGFYMGELNGVKGLVPSNFLREMLSDEEDRRGKLKGRMHVGRPEWHIK